jgi:outer membrane protein assembly factor BamB
VADRDPDAIWKPGYTGAVVWHPQRRPRRTWVLLVAVVAAAVIATGLTAWRITRDGEGDESAGDRIPTHADERWTVTLDASSVATVTGSGDTIVAAVGPEPRLVALDADSGVERWRVPAPDESLISLEVGDDVVVADYLDAGGDQSLAGFDLGDGRRLWTARVAQGRGSIVTDALIVPRFVRAQVTAVVDLLDVSSGNHLASIAADEISMSSTSIVRRQGDHVEWYDPDTLERRGRVDLDATDLQRFESSFAPTDAGLVAATSQRAVLVDASGTVVSSVRLSTGRDGPPTLDELDGSGRFVVVEGATETTMLTIRDGRLEALWTRSARAVDWLIDDSHQLLAILPWGDQPGAYDLGAPWMEVVDATTGRPTWAGRLTRSVEGSFSVLGGNGFVAAGASTAFGPPTVAGYAFDGTELWRHPVVAGGRPLTLLSGALVAVGATASGAATLTLLS